MRQPSLATTTGGGLAVAGPLIALFGLLALGGCAAPAIEPASLTAEGSAARLDARSLDDRDLRVFLTDNLGHEPTTWGFEELCWVAFYYNPSLEIARAQWELAKAAQRTAGARPNPSLTLSPGYNFTRQSGVSPWMPAISADLLMPGGGKRARQEEMARCEAEAARLGVTVAAWQVRGELRRALNEAAAAERRSALLDTLRQTQRRLMDLLQRRYELGSIGATELATTRTALLRAEVASGEAAAQKVAARARVAALLGVPVAALNGVELPSRDAPPAMTASTAMARQTALRSRADVLQALARYRSADAALALEVARRIPDLHLGPAYQWDQGQNKWSLGLTLEVPVFHRNEGPIAEALARRTEAAAQFNLIQNQALAAIDAAELATDSAARQLDRARALRDEVARQARYAADRRRVGAADQVDVLTVQSDLQSAELALVEAEIAADAAAAQLDDALQAGPLPVVKSAPTAVR